jgi:hypothetical protein
MDDLNTVRPPLTSRQSACGSGIRAAGTCLPYKCQPQWQPTHGCHFIRSPTMILIDRSPVEKAKYFAALLIMLLLGACTIRIAPDYSPETASAIVATQRQIDTFYAGLLAAPEDQRKFQTFSKGYQDVEVELRTLILRCTIQPLNKNATDLAKGLLDKLHKDEDLHKTTDAYPTDLAKLHQKQFDDALADMAIVQSDLKDSK